MLDNAVRASRSMHHFKMRPATVGLHSRTTLVVRQNGVQRQLACIPLRHCRGVFLLCLEQRFHTFRALRHLIPELGRVAKCATPGRLPRARSFAGEACLAWEQFSVPVS